MKPTPLWIAQRHGQDWRDPDVLAAVEWLTSQVPATAWDGRFAAAEETFEAAKRQWAEGNRVRLFDEEDTAAWYVHQARAYADPRHRPNWFEPEAYRIATVFKRLGQQLSSLKTIDGADERAARLMTGDKSRPDDGIYELLVAAAYRSRDWPDVAFVRERPGIEKRPDLFVTSGRRHWAVECKRVGRSGYAEQERLKGNRMADEAHAIAGERNRSVIMMVRFTTELRLIADDYLAKKVARFVEGRAPLEWADDNGTGVVLDIEWGKLQHILGADDIFFGSSRMIELLMGRYEMAADYSVAGEWTPASRITSA